MILNEQIESLSPELLLRYCKGQCIEVEKVAIERLAENSEGLREQLRLCRISLALGEDIREMEAIDVLSAYNQTRYNIRAKRMKRFNNQLMRCAAFLTLPFFLSSLILGYLNFKEVDTEIQYAEITAVPGSVIRYELPDKSIVWLNAGSKLSFPTIFRGETREVVLQGEAYFEVQADKEHPFYVNTPDGLSVYVYGTQFNVNAYEDENYIETVLEKGHVNVISSDRKTTVKLEPGERLVYDKASLKLTKSKVDVYEKTAWKDGKIIFRNAPLDEILKRLARHFNVDIQLNNKLGKEYTYRATFRNETLPQILDYLSKTAALKWKMVEPVQQQNETLTKVKVMVELY